ncbi:MAG: glycoside hydrolase family 3 C-terminal domain-containing protein, partial [Lachnospiraceae bacterium]|nr:glycoside hydrolase family 3 C-terminal domain-containing protein [Lachnospiraceae bacterium]
MSKVFCAPTDEKMTVREKEHMRMAREIAADGMVLLENTGVLPLGKDTKKIALFGAGARRTEKGGSGSGDVNSRIVVSVEDGLENAGYEIVNKKWLDAYEAQFDQAMKDYVVRLQEETVRQNTSIFMLLMTMPFIAPPMNCVTEENLPQNTDTAIYVITRKAGEGADRHPVMNDFLLSEDELADLTLLGREYKNFIVVLNVGGVIDTKPLRTISGIGAVLLMSQAGCAGGDALADIISGKVTPSGKLTATWANNYEDYPTSKHFSHMDGNLDDSFYKEGIYVGYRYFDTFGVDPAYCFGYGKSYTDFEIASTDVSVRGDEAILDVNVKNIGNRYAGKEVVQVYISAPNGLLDKPYQELKAYKKTKLLQPQKEENLRLTFKLAEMASYSEKESAWILESGMYEVRVGNSSRQTKIAARLHVKETMTVLQLKKLFGDKEFSDELNGTDASEYYHYEGEDAERKAAPVIEISSENILCKKAEYSVNAPEYECKSAIDKISLEDVRLNRATSEDLIAQLNEEELAALCVGNLKKTEIVSSMIGNSSGGRVPGAAGETTDCMEESRGIAPVALADGPAGLRLTKVFHTRNGEFVNEFQTPTPDMERLLGYLPEDAVPATDLSDTVSHYQYCTAIPIDTLLAQTWDYNRIRQAGEIVGKEMEIFGVSLWLAPGMNIQRDPMCGRNFEYYSEDPLVTGMCASACTEGVQSIPGKGTTIKHFACNNQEDNRLGNNSHVSERALREIYLKGFEICVKRSQPKAVMTSYNLLNG